VTTFTSSIQLRKYSRSNPNRVCIHVTKHCNLQCSYCLSSSSPDERRSPADVAKIISTIRWIGVHFATISGGEPFLLPNIAALVSGLQGVTRGIKLTTNGTVSLVPAVLDLLRPTDELNISIDEPPSAWYRSYRTYTQSQHLRIFRALSSLRGSRVPVSVNVVLSRQNCTHLIELMQHLLAANAEIAYVALLPMATLGRAGQFPGGAFLGEREIEESGERLKGNFPSVDIRTLSFYKAENDYVVVDSEGNMTLPGRRDSEAIRLSRP
jgi:molybdenum cofactor biosynthesis enzyme MoaA